MKYSKGYFVLPKVTTTGEHKVFWVRARADNEWLTTYINVPRYTYSGARYMKLISHQQFFKGDRENNTGKHYVFDLKQLGWGSNFFF